MTKEEKAKRYDETLEQARKELNTCGSLDCDAARQILRFFPQLRESEDEKIRKELIEFIQWSIDRHFMREDFHQAKRPSEWIAYLEKQKEPHYTKRNALFDKCVENCDPEVMKEVFDNVDKMLEPKIAFGDWGDKEKKEAIITCLKYMRFIKKITNQEYDDLTKWLNDNLVSNVLEKDGWTIANEQIDTIKEDYYGAFLRGEMRGYLRASKEKKPIKVYRVENEDKQKGLWRKFDGTWEPLFNMLTDGLCKNLPMEDNDLYRAEGKKWFASAPSRETLQKWFSKRDLEELTAAGFTISEFDVTNYKKVSEFEYIFTRDSIVNRTYLTVSDIYPEQKPAEKHDLVAQLKEHLANTPKERLEAEWSNEDSDILRDAICAVDILAKDFKKDNPHLSRTLRVAKEWLESLPERFTLAIKKKWDEFDKDCLKRAIWYVENPAPSVVKDTNLVLWLQSLPERFNLQPKQEWSEEDIDKMVNKKARKSGTTKTEMQFYRQGIEDTLKSLRPSWKPSEEQMRALENTLSDMPEHYKPKCTLETLLRDLKKL